MMQDFPKLLGPEARVGFTQMDRWICFSAVKNNIADAKKKAMDTGFSECASSGEADMYSVQRRKLTLAGAHVEEAAQPKVPKSLPLFSARFFLFQF
jgi:UDP-sugar pyrophosphorylase